MSLRLRLLAAFAYVLVLVLVALEIPLALSLSSRVDAEVRAQASAQAQLVAAAAAGSADEQPRLERLVRDAGRDLGARVIVVDLRGRLLADSAGEGLRLTSYRNRPEIREALAGRPAQGERRSETLGEELLFTAVPVIDDGRRVGASAQSRSRLGSRLRGCWRARSRVRCVRWRRPPGRSSAESSTRVPRSPAPASSGTSRSPSTT